jgi:small subunit ribosomal protein S1
MDTFDAITGQGVQPDSSQPVEIQAIDHSTHNEQTSMESLLEEQGLGLDFPKQGEIRTGVIATLGDNEILVSVGTKSEGIIAGKELESIPPEERSAFHVGLEIPVYVVNRKTKTVTLCFPTCALASNAIGQADELKASGML